MSRRLQLLSVLVSTFASSLSAQENTTPTAPLATFVVASGGNARHDTPVSAPLPASVNARGPLRLVEVRGDDRAPVPSQVESGDPALLWWVLAGETPANSSRTYELRAGDPVKAPAVTLEMNEATLDVGFGGQRLFSYNHRHVVPPEGIKPEFIRSGYIHPMFSPGGKLITEDFPADHHHHKGVWAPWTDTIFDGKPIDFWNLGKKQGTVQFAGFESVETGPVFGRFRVAHEFVDLTQGPSGKVALDEVWDVRVWAVGGPERGVWVWDLTSTQRCASSSPLYLEKYRYGGLGWRGPKEWNGDNYKVLTSEGMTKANGHTTRAKWCAHSGAIDGDTTTIVMMCSPLNRRFPETMRIWPSGGAFFNWAPIQAGPWTFVPGETYTFRYRFYIHEGGIDAERAERAWSDFGEPPAVTVR